MPSMATAQVIPLACPDLCGNERKYVNECLDAGWLTHAGRFEHEFEAAFAKRFGADCIATSSGTGALHLALLALGIARGDEVIVPDLTFGATAAAVLAVGATPVFVDVSPETWGIDHRRIPDAITARTKAIIPVHLYGEDAGDFREFGLPVIEDSCEALGLVPLRGIVACFSFYGNKIITTGEGGMIAGNAELLSKARAWRNGGFDSEYSHTVPGLNYRMTNIQAALGLAQIERLDYLLRRRLANVGAYKQALPGKGKWLFVATTKNPRTLAEHLAANGIESRPVFTPLHRCPAFEQYAKGRFDVSDEIWRTGLALPTGPHVPVDDIKKITRLVNVNFDLRRTPDSRS